MLRAILAAGLIANGMLPADISTGKVSFSLGDAWNAHSPIVADCTSTFSNVTNSFNVGYGGKNVAFGLNAGAGGFITSVILTGFPALNGINLTQPGAGRGDQGAANEAATQNLWNPTNAGEAKKACAPTTVIPFTGGYTIAQMNVGLFMQGNFDFVQCENVVADLNGSDGGNTDTDGVAETCPGEDAELRSEMDFKQTCENRSAAAHLAVMQCDFVWIYARSPGARKQFEATALDSTGSPVLDPTKYITDISKTIAGNQTTGADDLSVPLFPWSLRFTTDFPYLLWQSADGTWQNHDATQITGGNGGTGQFNYVLGTPDAYYAYVGGGSPIKSGTGWDTSGVLNDMMCMASSSDPNTAIGRCIWWPHDNYFNALQTGITDTGTLQVTYEDRRVESAFRFWPENTADAGIYPKLVMLPFLSGLRAPFGTTEEFVRFRFWECTDTPANCAAWVVAYKASGSRGDE